MILIIDNYDSFAYNLADAIGQKTAVQVVRNDAIDRPGVEALAPAGIILSPGPGHPGVARDFGVCADLVRDPLPVPMLGVCLGMQGMAHHTGGRVVPAQDIVHGEASPMTFRDDPLFAGIRSPTPVGRYHSLCVDAPSLPAPWRVLAEADGVAMAMAHRSRPWWGVQFHPESILTPQGPRMIANFLARCP